MFVYTRIAKPSRHRLGILEKACKFAGVKWYFAVTGVCIPSIILLQRPATCTVHEGG
jgi:hypothetical protein